MKEKLIKFKLTELEAGETVICILLSALKFEKEALIESQKEKPNHKLMEHYEKMANHYKDLANKIKEAANGRI